MLRINYNPNGRVFGKIGDYAFFNRNVYLKQQFDFKNIGWMNMTGVDPTPTPTETLVPDPTPTPTETLVPLPTPTPTPTDTVVTPDPTNPPTPTATDVTPTPTVECFPYYLFSFTSGAQTFVSESISYAGTVTVILPHGTQATANVPASRSFWDIIGISVVSMTGNVYQNGGGTYQGDYCG